ncbi:MAG: fumarylacetoacetate hydrolase family protein [Kiritimatiellae bacterium]|nr:fumarylacetoacetate hydrolase family protein [Kiritimatiellia bacterium]
MKLVRFGERGAEKPGVLLENVPAAGQTSILDVRAMAFDIEDYDEHFFAHHGPARVRNLLTEAKRTLIPADGVRLGPPVARPGKIMCLGKNYAAHAKEFASGVPEVPVVFSKAGTALNGPHDPIVLPREARTVDLEVELALVIGTTARRAGAEQAAGCIAGYMVLNDVTDRDVQRRGQQWFCGKSPDTFCPIGPWLVTPDDVADVNSLRLYSKVNDAVLQEGTTADLIFDIPTIIAYISRATTLLPGDIIATGTPAGVGSARKDPIVLKPGDTIELGVEGLGVQRNSIVREAG